MLSAAQRSCQKDAHPLTEQRYLHCRLRALPFLVRETKILGRARVGDTSPFRRSNHARLIGVSV